MPYGRSQADESVRFFKDLMPVQPVVGLLTGTGLGRFGDEMEHLAALDYAIIPHFPASTVQSHAGRLILGRLDGIPVLVFQGRFHLYEGYRPEAVAYPVRILQTLGVHTVILTNAAGGLNPEFRPGEIMIITDHINLTGANPLVGPNEDAWGIRFPDMARVYDPKLAAAARQAAAEAGTPCREGVYAGLRGPSLETPAEVRFLRTIGADAVGFSTVQEAVAAVHARIRILGLSVITNVHDPDHPTPATVDEVIAVAGQAAPRLQAMVRRVIGGMELPV